MSIAAPLKWHGGKHYLAPKIVTLMPRHLHYVEPYFGGGAVLFARDPQDETKFWGTKSHERGVSEVINDINGELMDFWRVLQNPRDFREFKRVVEATPFSQMEWERTEDLGRGRVTRAVRFFVRCRQSLAGRMDDFATLSRNRTRRGMNEQASAWLTCVEGLPAVHERLKRVVILNKSAIEVIQQQDSPKTLFYCDPPYLHETRASTDAYQHEMTGRDHGDLLIALSNIKGKFMLSGYRHEVYDRLSQSCEWRREDFSLPNNAAGGKSKRRMTECLWMNFQPPK
ncbi:MAG: DNA adenine methylase [Planctomycetota bacterium]|jgi:DNA adenine methylase